MKQIEIACWEMKDRRNRKQGGAAGDMMSRNWLTDSESYRLLGHTPGCGAAFLTVVYVSGLGAFMYLKDRDRQRAK